MRFRRFSTGLILLAVATVFAAEADRYQSTFTVDKKTLGVKGSNPYFNLTPGYQLAYRHGNDTEALTMLNETKVIDGVVTRVMEDRETKNGKLSEVTRDYFAIDSVTNDVYYFGEDVDVYRDGKVVDHKGSWLSGVNGALFGMMMPANPKPGQRFYQERAPGVGMDRVEILSTQTTIATPAGTFKNCVHVVETSAIENGLKDFKWYAAGVGPVRDAEMVLVKYGGK